MGCGVVGVLAWANIAHADETVKLPLGFSVHDAIYSEVRGVLLLRLDDRLMIFDPETSHMDAVLLPEPTLSIAELDGDVAVGAENGIYRVDVQRGRLTGRLETPVPADGVALGDSHVWVLQNDEDGQGVWWLPWNRGDKAGFAALPIENQGVLQQSETGPVLFDRWLSSVGLRRLGLDNSGALEIRGCPQFYRARSQRIWMAGRHVFLDTGHKLDFEAQACPPGDWQELAYSTRLPVDRVAALCGGPGWIALVQRARGASSGRHLDVIASPFPRRLGAFQLPSLVQGEDEPAWGRHIACDGPGGRVFVVVQDRWWNDGGGTWGLATFDLAPLQSEIEKSKAWAKLLH